jgi:hypothetical protein
MDLRRDSDAKFPTAMVWKNEKNVISILLPIFHDADVDGPPMA